MKIQSHLIPVRTLGVGDNGVGIPMYLNIRYGQLVTKGGNITWRCSGVCSEYHFTSKGDDSTSYFSKWLIWQHRIILSIEVDGLIVYPYKYHWKYRILTNVKSTMVTFGGNFKTVFRINSEEKIFDLEIFALVHQILLSLVHCFLESQF